MHFTENMQQFSKKEKERGMKFENMTTYIIPIRVEWQNDNIKAKPISPPLGDLLPFIPSYLVDLLDLRYKHHFKSLFYIFLFH